MIDDCWIELSRLLDGCILLSAFSYCLLHELRKLHTLHMLIWVASKILQQSRGTVKTIGCWAEWKSKRVAGAKRAPVGAKKKLWYHDVWGWMKEMVLFLYCTKFPLCDNVWQSGYYWDGCSYKKCITTKSASKWNTNLEKYQQIPSGYFWDVCSIKKWIKPKEYPNTNDKIQIQIMTEMK